MLFDIILLNNIIYRGHPISLQIFRKLHDWIVWKLVNFCNITRWTQSLAFLFKNFIALWRHLAKTQLLCDAQIYLYSMQWDRMAGGPVFCATLYVCSLSDDWPALGFSLDLERLEAEADAMKLVLGGEQPATVDTVVVVLVAVLSVREELVHMTASEQQTSTFWCQQRQYKYK